MSCIDFKIVRLIKALVYYINNLGYTMSDKFTIWDAFQSGQVLTGLGGFAGSVVYIATNKNLSARDSVAAVLTGCILAAYIAPVVGHHMSADNGMLSLLGLIIGIAGMHIGPALTKSGEAITQATLRKAGLKIDTNPGTKDNKNDGNS